MPNNAIVQTMLAFAFQNVNGFYFMGVFSGLKEVSFRYLFVLFKGVFCSLLFLSVVYSIKR